MAHIFKVIMKAEKHDFYICQNRFNSKEMIFFAMPRDTNIHKHMGVVQNKTGNVAVMDSCGFTEKTIAKLRAILTNL